jgi:uncharacterized membrane protein YagU involved in acid resistance
MAQLREDLCQGVVAGFIATTPMTVVMDLWHANLPPDERDPLPPRQVVENTTAKAGVRHEMTAEQRRELFMLAHFGYGAGVGALYGPLARRLVLPPVVSGIAYGLGVWAASYLGYLPALGLYKRPEHEPSGRHGMLIAGHVVWGATLGLMTALLDRRRAENPSAPGTGVAPLSPPMRTSPPLMETTR